MFYQIFLITILALPLEIITSHPHTATPCAANIFTYIPDELTHNTWYGQLHLFIKHDVLVTLHGIFIDLIFDKPAILVEIDGWHQATTQDGREFHAENLNFKLRPGEVIDLNFYVKYAQTNGKIPQLITFRLNGVNMCSNIDSTIVFREPAETKHNSRNNGNSNRNHDYGFGKPNKWSRNKNQRNQKNTNRGNWWLQNRNKKVVDIDPRVGDTEESNRSFASFERSSTVDKNSGADIANCGDIETRPIPLVVAGEEPYFGQFPWHAALYTATKDDGNLEYKCGGSLITQYMVISAAHCVTFLHTRKLISIDHLLIYMGKYNLQKWLGNEQTIKVSDIIIDADKYIPDHLHADIAVIKLMTAAHYSHYIRPVCLWNFDNDLSLLTNQVGLVPGWGYNENGVHGENLSYVRMPIVTQQTCIFSNPGPFSRLVTNESYCAGFKNGSSVCNGDSGGGMVFERNNKWYLRGIVSVAIPRQNENRCDPNQYVVFTDVSKFVTWIHNLE